MNTKISLLCLSCCFAAAFSMSINLPFEPVRAKNVEHIVEKINLHNKRIEKREVSHKMDINSLTDKDPAEHNKMQSKHEPETFNTTVFSWFPDSYDWKINRTLSPVPNMRDCNRSDWAFAAVGMLEGYLYQQKHISVSLSTQDLLECSGDLGNMGCNGGYVKKAFEYIQENGISEETKYPFTIPAKVCDKSCPREGIRKGSTITLKDLNLADVHYMKSHLYNVSPIIAAISASSKFFNYKAGEIFEDEVCKDTDDEEDEEEPYNVLIVGYNKTESKEYWIVKNWMGADWGENGYAKVASNGTKCNGIFSKIITITDMIIKNLV